MISHFGATPGCLFWHYYSLLPNGQSEKEEVCCRGYCFDLYISFFIPIFSISPRLKPWVDIFVAVIRIQILIINVNTNSLARHTERSEVSRLLINEIMDPSQAQDDFPFSIVFSYLPYFFLRRGLRGS